MMILDALQAPVELVAEWLRTKVCKPSSKPGTMLVGSHRPRLGPCHQPLPGRRLQTKVQPAGTSQSKEQRKPAHLPRSPSKPRVRQPCQHPEPPRSRPPRSPESPGTVRYTRPRHRSCQDQTRPNLSSSSQGLQLFMEGLTSGEGISNKQKATRSQATTETGHQPREVVLSAPKPGEAPTNRNSWSTHTPA